MGSIRCLGHRGGVRAAHSRQNKGDLLAFDCIRFNKKIIHAFQFLCVFFTGANQLLPATLFNIIEKSWEHYSSSASIGVFRLILGVLNQHTYQPSGLLMFSKLLLTLFHYLHLSVSKQVLLIRLGLGSHSVCSSIIICV